MAGTSCGRWAGFALAAMALAWGAGGWTQETAHRQNAETVPASLEEALRGMSRQADVVFTGRVTAVRVREGEFGATAVAEVDFAVQDAVRGVGGRTYRMRQWGGLWQGDAPFRVGQRYLMLLHAPGASGLSSPVGGMDGAIPIRAGAAAGLNDPQVDLRWVGARVARAVVYAPTRGGSSVGAPMLRGGLVMEAGEREVSLAPADAAVVVAPRWDAIPDAASAASPAETALPLQRGYADVLTMLRNWERDDHGQ
jgi:hypothetical protein